MFDERIKKLKELLDENKIDGLFISAVPSITYLTGFSNFSKEEREAYLLITKQDQFIITDGRYKEAIKKEVKHFKLTEVSSRQNLETIIKKSKKKLKSLGIEEIDLTVSEYRILKKYFKTLKNIHIKSARSIKSKEEIIKLKDASKLGDMAFEFILKKIKPGISEKQIAFELEFFIRSQGADISFDPIIAFDKNSSVPHHQTGETVLSQRSGQFILLDFGIKYKNYCSDMTRTIFFGRPDNKKKNIYKTVFDSQAKAVDFINNCIKQKRLLKVTDVDKLARDYIKVRNFPDIPHSLGHGVGLEVHEPPYLSSKSKEVLKEGMVFSIEPGIYIENYGGVRIEDLYVYEDGQIRQITNSLKNLIII